MVVALARVERTSLRRKRTVHQLAELANSLAEHQADTEQGAARRWEELELRAGKWDARHVEVEQRLDRIDAHLRWIIDVAVPRKRQRAAMLRQLLHTQRTDAPTKNKTLLLYAVAFAVVWLALWQLALALGFR